MEGFEKYKEDLRSALTYLIKYVSRDENYYSSMGTVKSVDETEKTCEVQIVNGSIIEDVRLQQVSSATGLLTVPAVDSMVLVGWTDKTTAFVQMYSQISEILFQDGANGGLIKITDITTKLNALVAETAAYKPFINTHTHISAAPGVATAVPAPLFGGSFTDFNKDDYENQNFKH